MNRNQRHKTALITGASSGIGLELTLLFARDQYDLVLVARSAERLAELAAKLQRDHGISVRILARDLSKPETPNEIYSELARESIKVDVLVNNAGFGRRGYFAETSLAGDMEMMQLNMVALTELTKLFLKDMLERHDGKILNVASTAGFQPGPLMAVYYATKAYVLLFSEAVANELNGSGVTMTVLCPGPTRTGFSERAGAKESRLFTGVTMDARSVAQIGYRGLMQGKTLVIPGLRNQVLAFSVGLAPRRMVTWISRRMQEVRMPSLRSDSR